MKKSTTIILGIITLLVIGYFFVKPKLENKKQEFTYTTIKKGDIEAIVSSTGTLEAINTVEVGTQISGTISKIYVDYNDKVNEGQLLAEMDLRLLQTNLLTAQANLAVNEARFKQAEEDFERNKVLYKEKVISEQQYNNSKYTYEQVLSSKKASEASVKNIEVSMSYARIKSPINGTIIERTVEEGQTVAASFATPRMFIIAEDLSKMQILADVDESDIGYIKDSMQVRFSVQTFPEVKFYGLVSQIRLQPIKINNVVNYQVVVDVDNKNGMLLPGMTTNLEFILDTAYNVLLINNSALRFRPNEAMLKDIKPVLKEKTKWLLVDSIRQNFIEAITNEETYTPANFKSNLPPHINGFFYKDETGKIDFKFIETGITSGLESEIKKFLDETPLREGDKIINSIKEKK
ncbi:efflux RND transporter periplasmic adaptor subunit [Thalassobellus suaedae]|uniref:Efflux RND transporter periplasmic adaptor subunit n=1 Tax=Thalassobellus suaedae TaxID=3074124 RepID=A0ABY9XPE6_9FLAO|nr:efflux RND transporter periplasmic adaptor subunit [Flavobacteriaceae bacterium HL-DH14]